MKPSHHRLIPNWLLLICAVVLIIALSYLVWFYVTQPEPTGTTTPVASTNANTNLNSTTTAGWKTYTNTVLGLNFKYPTDWFIFESTDSKRIYIQNVEQTSEGQWNKSNMPSTFERIWISYDPTNYKQYDMGNPTNYNCEKETIINKNQSITFYNCPKPNDGAPFAYAYWGNNNQYSAQTASEIPLSNEQDEVLKLKQLLSTFQFTP